MISTKVEPILLANGLIQDPGAVPLVIAVAGHRDPRPEYVPLIRKNFQRQLEQLLDLLPHTPLVMLNGLAEGMDSEAASVFLEVVAADRTRRGPLASHHQLVGALPKSPEAYREDFDHPAALYRMEQLLGACDAVLHPGNCSELAVRSNSDGARFQADNSACYGQQGVFLVRHCYLLFGFYDGIESQLVGGTSQTVSMQKGELHPLFVSVDEVLANKEPGALVIHHTPRLKEGSPLGSPGAIQFWSGSPTVDDLAAFDVIRLPSKLLTIPKKLEEINIQLTNPVFLDTIYNDEEGRSTKLWSLANHHAIHNKRRYEIWCRVLVISGFGLVLLAELSAVAQGLWWALLLLAFLFFPKLQQGPKLHFIAQRCLTECLTVQYLWSALNIDYDTADLFHTRSNSDLGWIRTVLRAVRVQLLAFHVNEPRVWDNAVFKAEIWISQQVGWMRKRINDLLELAALWQRLAFLLAVSAIVVATIQSLPGAKEDLSSYVVVLLAGFASALAYSNLIGYTDTADRYQRSLRQFERGQKGMEFVRSEQDTDQAQMNHRQQIVVEALGREKLDELNDWVAGQLQRVYAPGA